MVAVTADPDLFRLVWLVLFALFVGGAGRLIWTYSRNPRSFTGKQRGRFAVEFGIVGGALLVAGFGMHLVPRSEALSAGTLIGIGGLILILVTIYLLLS